MDRPDPADLQATIGNLTAALATQPMIDQAKGMIMMLRSCDADTAFAALREVSQHTQVELHDVAAVIVASGARTTLTAVDEDTARRVRQEIRLRILGALYEK
ncbi:ANTAR domain-containing protein [Amycolatopsis thailandensis]|uniref:ANTAR domain-containing protein n=1 Tax=Amycolatopsis thailandensis TaxID=589330 RepID=UPI00362BE084